MFRIWVARGYFIQNIMGDFVRGDFVLGGILSRGILSGGFCQGFCQGGFCPKTMHQSGFQPKYSAETSLFNTTSQLCLNILTNQCLGNYLSQPCGIEIALLQYCVGKLQSIDKT